MTETTVMDVRRGAFDVYIGRATRLYQCSPWGNPFKVGRDGSRAEVVAKYRYWVFNSGDIYARYVREHVHELRGKRLGCWCHPKLCHGNVLAELADMEDIEWTFPEKR